MSVLITFLLLLHRSTSNKSKLITLEKSRLISGTLDDIHIVFTTGCNGYQNWQSEVLLYSWVKVKQPGRITRIAAGCKTSHDKELANRTGIPNDDNRFSVYFTPDYTPKDSGNFYYFNKPHGMNQWLHDPNVDIYESVIVLIDPDMIITKQFLFHIKSEADKFSKFQETYTGDGNAKKNRDLYVREGHPVSQKYGIGSKWVKWKGFCDSNPNCSVSDEIGWKRYAVGPPYMMHINDWKRITPLWVEYSPLALKYEPTPSILAEMYSYVIACAYFKLEHEYLFSMISDPHSSKWMEVWNVLNWDFMNKNITNRMEEELNDNILFHIIHYCQGFWLGKDRNDGTIRLGGWNWHKGHIPQDIMYNCDIPLMVEIRDDSNGKSDEMKLYINRDEYNGKRKERQREANHGGINRNVWILYHLNKYLNMAIMNYRNKYCPNGEYNHSFVLVLQQPGSNDGQGRMNYVLGDYQSGKSWRGH